MDDGSERRASSYAWRINWRQVYCLASYHAAADSLIFTRFNNSALATKIKVEPDVR